MGSKKSHVFTLEENLVLTNEELTSNWSKLASFIYSYENGTWDNAKAKAGELLTTKKAFEYIDTVRYNVKHGIEPKGEKEKEKEQEKPKSVSIVSLPKPQKSIYERNYERLIKIVPDLETRLTEAKKSGERNLYGKSRQSGYQDFSFDLLDFDKTSFYVAIAHYYKQNGDMVPDPDMVIRIDISEQIVEALTFQNSLYYSEVYDDTYTRKLTNLKEKKSQNNFLATWLKNLKEQGQVIVWDEELKIEPTTKKDKSEESESELIDEYSKTKEEKNEQKKEVKPAQRRIEPKKAGEIVKKEPESMIPEKRKKSESEVKRLASLIAVVENVNDIIAENKAEELIRKDEETKYILDKTDFLKKSHLKKLFQSNYKKLILLFPDLLTRFESDEIKELLYSQKLGNSTRYELIKGVNLKNGTQQFFFYQFRQDGSKQGTLAIGVNDKDKTAKVLIISESFRFQSDFSDFENDLVTEDKYNANEWLDEWILSLMKKDYCFKSTTKEQTNVSEENTVVEPKTEAPEQTPEQIKAEIMEAYKENAKKIPDFEVGKVEHTEYHKKAGVDKRIINWINKNRKGMTLKPREKMVFNTKNKLVDLMHHAMKPGMRISKTGKIYYEGRSNRSDLTNTGL